MATYQPTLTLSWKYENNSGKLYIVAKINVDILPTEKVTATKTDVANRASAVTVNVATSGVNVPVTQEPYYTNIGAGLNTEANVRPRIAAQPNVNVTTKVMKGGAEVGSNNTSTSAGNQLIIT